MTLDRKTGKGSLDLATPVTSAEIGDGEIVNADISATAGIAKTKLANLDVVNADVNASAAIVASKLSGVTTPTSTDTLTNKTFDANGTGNSISNIDNADITNSTIQAGKISFFESTEQTGTGAEQSIAHGLGRTPALVILIPTKVVVIGDDTFVKGVADGTNVKATVTLNAKYIIVAL